ncbi:MAG: hypothetical protein JW751_07770 [Polyangiaceae bacterium]|nr:hypothetical protein [Polyangiaceae bacterium]
MADPGDAPGAVFLSLPPPPEASVPWNSRYCCQSDGPAPVTIELLIHSLVRQTTVLIAQLATSGGTRAPLAQVANQVFLDLVRELERQGVSRKVSADMFGLGLRTYQRKIQRLTASATEGGQTLWVAVLKYVESHGPVSRAELLGHFYCDDEVLVRGVLHDLCESGLVTVQGSGASVTYGIVPEEELARLRQTRHDEGFDELVWALIYRQGPLGAAQLAEQFPETSGLEAALARLVESGRVEYSPEAGVYHASILLVPLGAEVGWEAAVYDHFNALVNTITGRLREQRSAASLKDSTGGSTYTLEVWPNHPHKEEVRETLRSLRSQLGELRGRVERYNAEHARPEDFEKVLLYIGQCVIPQDTDRDSDHD